MGTTDIRLICSVFPFEEKMQTNNVIVFPKAKSRQTSDNRVNPVVTLKGAEESAEQVAHYHIQKSVSLIVPHLFNQLHIAGFTPDSDDDFVIKEGAFIVESIRSYMFAFYGLKHPFQKIVDRVFIEEENDGKDVLTIAKNIMVTLGD
jgi:hypothetical protein